MTRPAIILALVCLAVSASAGAATASCVDGYAYSRTFSKSLNQIQRSNSFSGSEQYGQARDWAKVAWNTERTNLPCSSLLRSHRTLVLGAFSDQWNAYGFAAKGDWESALYYLKRSSRELNTATTIFKSWRDQS